MYRICLYLYKEMSQTDGGLVLNWDGFSRAATVDLSNLHAFGTPDIDWKGHSVCFCVLSEKTVVISYRTSPG